MAGGGAGGVHCVPEVDDAVVDDEDVLDELAVVELLESLRELLVLLDRVLLELEAAELRDAKKLSRLSSSWASRSVLEEVVPDVLEADVLVVEPVEVESEVAEVLELMESVELLDGGGPGGGALPVADADEDESVVCDDESPDMDVPLSLEDIDIRYAINSEVRLPIPPLAVDEESAVVEAVELVSDEEVEEVPVVEALLELFSQSTRDE